MFQASTRYAECLAGSTGLGDTLVKFSATSNKRRLLRPPVYQQCAQSCKILERLRQTVREIRPSTDTSVVVNMTPAELAHLRVQFEQEAYEKKTQKKS